MSGAYLPLAMAAEGEKVRVAAFAGGKSMQKKLGDLGIVPDKIIKVVNKQERGGIVVSVEETRLALGFGMAQKVLVEPLG